MIFTRPPQLIAARLAAIRAQSGTASPSKPGFFFRVVKRPLSVRERADKARREMAAIRARFEM